MFERSIEVSSLVWCCMRRHHRNDDADDDWGLRPRTASSGTVCPASGDRELRAIVRLVVDPARRSQRDGDRDPLLHAVYRDQQSTVLLHTRVSSSVPGEPFAPGLPSRSLAGAFGADTPPVPPGPPAPWLCVHVPVIVESGV